MTTITEENTTPVGLPQLAASFSSGARQHAFAMTGASQQRLEDNARLAQTSGSPTRRHAQRVRLQKQDVSP